MIGCMQIIYILARAYLFTFEIVSVYTLCICKQTNYLHNKHSQLCKTCLLSAHFFCIFKLSGGKNTELQVTPSSGERRKLI